MTFDDSASPVFNNELLTAIKNALDEADRSDIVGAIRRLHEAAASAKSYRTTLARLHTLVAPLHHTIAQAAQDYDKAVMDTFQHAAAGNRVSNAPIAAGPSLPPVPPAPSIAPTTTETTPAELYHATREPHVPCEATIIEMQPLAIKLVRRGPGDVVFQLLIDGQIRGTVPFDNLVKAATRIDPDHATGPEKQIQDLRRALSEARGELYTAQVSGGYSKL